MESDTFVEVDEWLAGLQSSQNNNVKILAEHLRDLVDPACRIMQSQRLRLEVTINRMAQDKYVDSLGTDVALIGIATFIHGKK